MENNVELSIIFKKKCVSALLFIEHMNQTYLEFDEQK